MSRMPAARVAALVLLYAGLGLVVAGSVQIASHRNLALALMALGFASVVAGAWLAPRSRDDASDPDGDARRDSRGRGD